jgi:predicted nucleic acid binding AN1-type Zn finger protein
VLSPSGVITKRCYHQAVLSPSGVITKRCYHQAVLSPSGAITKRCYHQAVLSPSGVINKVSGLVYLLNLWQTIAGILEIVIVFPCIMHFVFLYK